MVEYVLLVAAVLVVCIYFFTTSPMSTSVNASLNTMVSQLNALNREIQF